MGDFFHDQRVTGCVTLMMALVFTGEWIRSWHQHLFFQCVGGQLCLRRGAIDFIEDETIPAKTDKIVDEDGILHSPIRWSVPCWSIVWPLTLLSAYLLLWPGKRAVKRRQSSEAISTTISDPVPADGAE